MKPVEIAIIGAGPAGLSAALYAARFCRSTLVLHDAKPRSRSIPRTYNVPGYEDGIAGTELLARMTRHAEKYGARIVEAHIDEARCDDKGFHLTDGNQSWHARSLILATGLEDNQIAFDHDTHQEAINHGVLRYCPICDGFEHKGMRIAVVGCDVSGAAEALFIRGYSDDVTLIPRHDVELTASERRDLADAGIKTITEPVVRYVPKLKEMELYFNGKSRPAAFDVLYPALGCRPKNMLAKKLGLKLTNTGKVDADTPFGSPIPGLYCAGDLVEGLDQISVAIAHGTIAATRAHNWLREMDGRTVNAVFEPA
ncbi:MAG: NAD(P)/FAD-dependent oxidoreductase [Sphingorhabdus sp.]